MSLLPLASMCCFIEREEDVLPSLATIFLWSGLHSEPDHQQRWLLCLFYMFLTLPLLRTHGSEATFSDNQDGSFPVRVPSV